MVNESSVEVAKEDLLDAWQVLEKLAVSFDQIGGALSGEDGSSDGAEIGEALASYVTPKLVKEINDARLRLGRYIEDAEAEKLSDGIDYWLQAQWQRQLRESDRTDAAMDWAERRKKSSLDRVGELAAASQQADEEARKARTRERAE